VAKAVSEFVVGEIQPVSDDIEEKKKASVRPSQEGRELGFLLQTSGEYGGQDLDKVSSLLVWEKMAQGGGSFMSAFGAIPELLSSYCLFGTKRPKKRYLPRMATGRLLRLCIDRTRSRLRMLLNSKTTPSLAQMENTIF